MAKKGLALGTGVIFFVLTLLAPIFLGPRASVAQENKGPIKIGIDTELTGVVSETGTNIKMGYDVYLQEIGYKVAGRDIKIIENDNKTDYKIAMEVAQRLVEKDQVAHIGFWNELGGGFGGTGLCREAQGTLRRARGWPGESR